MVGKMMAVGGRANSEVGVSEEVPVNGVEVTGTGMDVSAPLQPVRRRIIKVGNRMLFIVV
jgi:hypothetical protein